MDDYEGQVRRLTAGLEVARAERNAAQTRAAELEREVERVRGCLLHAAGERDEACAEVERLSELHLGEFRARLAMQRERDEACAHVAAATDAVTGAGVGPREMPLPALVTLLAARMRDTFDEKLKFLRERDEVRAEVEVWKKEHAKVHGDWIETRKKCTEAQAEHAKRHDELTNVWRPRVKHVEQPMPTGNGIEVFRVAIADCPSVSLAEALKAREAVGIERYGTTLRTHNGRDVVRDLREELADAYVYATQAGMEAEAGEPPPDHLLSSVRWALVEAWRALEEHERRRRLEVP